MLLWLILGCSENTDSPSGIKDAQEMQTPSVESRSSDNTQAQKTSVGRSGQQMSPSQNGQNGQNGPRAGNGPKGPPNGNMGPSGMRSQGGGPAGTAQMKQPEPFHATVTFDWVDDSINV